MDVVVVNHTIMWWSTTFLTEWEKNADQLILTTNHEQIENVPHSITWHATDNTTSSFQAFRSCFESPASSQPWHRCTISLFGIHYLKLSNSFVLAKLNIRIKCNMQKWFSAFKATKIFAETRKKQLHHSGAFNAKNNCVVTKYSFCIHLNTIELVSKCISVNWEWEQKCIR